MERTNNTKKIHSNKRFFLVYEFEVTSIVMIDTVITKDTVPFSRERYIYVSSIEEIAHASVVKIIRRNLFDIVRHCDILQTSPIAR